MDRQREERLLTDTGNERRHAAVAREIITRPPNTLFDLNDPDPNCLEETMKV